MALSTEMIKIILHMVGVGNILVIGGVARIAIAWSIIESRRMTGDTRLRTVRSSQRELRLRVIEIGRDPGRGCMALTAKLAEIILNMVGVDNPIIIPRMTGIAIGGYALISR